MSVPMFPEIEKYMDKHMGNGCCCNSIPYHALKIEFDMKIAELQAQIRQKDDTIARLSESINRLTKESG